MSRAIKLIIQLKIMKILKNIGLTALCLTIIATLAFRPSTEKTPVKPTSTTLFVFNGTTNGTDEFLPNNYGTPPAGFQADEIPLVTSSCPGTGKVCAVEVTSDQINGSSKPKVDVNPVQAAIISAKASGSLDGVDQGTSPTVIKVYVKS